MNVLLLKRLHSIKDCCQLFEQLSWDLMWVGWGLFFRWFLWSDRAVLVLDWYWLVGHSRRVIFCLDNYWLVLQIWLWVDWLLYRQVWVWLSDLHLVNRILHERTTRCWFLYHSVLTWLLTINVIHEPSQLLKISRSQSLLHILIQVDTRLHTIYMVLLFYFLALSVFL